MIGLWIELRLGLGLVLVVGLRIELRLGLGLALTVTPFTLTRSPPSNVSTPSCAEPLSL